MLLLTNADAFHIPLADKSCHVCITSPPYWKLRDYGIKGQVGLEETIEEYVENMVKVFREVKRVLRDDASLWLNLGDSYNGSGGGHKDGQDQSGLGFVDRGLKTGYQPPNNAPNLKPKDLCGIPWRLAFALQADGWWLRSDIIWSKPNPMPESVTDRPTKAHEYLFLLTKSAKYFYDNDAVREDARYGPNLSGFRGGHGRYINNAGFDNDGDVGKAGPSGKAEPSGRNRRTVWHIATAPYSGAHFATYPPALVEPCIKAGTSERGVCPECGAPWERIIERVGSKPYRTGKSAEKASVGLVTAFSGYEDGSSSPTFTTLGWRPTCSHSHDPIPATVFDPFAGSGTTLQVARALGRNGVGLDLSLEYLHLARTRLSLDALEAWTDGVGQSDDGKDGAHKNKQVPRQVHSFHDARKEKGVTDLPMFGGQDEN